MGAIICMSSEAVWLEQGVGVRISVGDKVGERKPRGWSTEGRCGVEKVRWREREGAAEKRRSGEKVQ